MSKEGLRNKRLVDATFDDFEDFLDEYINTRQDLFKKEENAGKIRGLKAIADILHISTRTLSTLRKETKIFDNVIKQKGRIITADIKLLNTINLQQ